MKREPGKAVLFSPGYADAVEREGLVRDACFLGLTEDVAGFEVLPMSLRHYIVLRLAACPLLWERRPSAVELATFLWVLSPESGRGLPQSKALRARFLRRCRGFAAPSRPWLRTAGAMRRFRRRRVLAYRRYRQVLAAAREYVAETMLDRPGKGNATSGRSYYSDMCFWWGALGRQGYLMSREQVLAMPLKVLFQCIREVKESQGETLTNPSSAKEIAKHLAKLNEGLAAMRGEGHAMSQGGRN